MLVTLSNVQVISGSRIRLDIDNLHIAKGERIALIGSNGSGKTTLYRTLLGLENFSGTIRYDQELFDSIKPSRPIIGYVPQNPQSSFCTLTVEDEILFTASNVGFSGSKLVSIVEETIEKCNLSIIRSAKLNDISGGQKQQVALACVLAMRPKLLLLDEPYAMLDSVSKNSISKLIYSLADDITIVCSSHSVSDFDGYSRLIYIDNGQVSYDGNYCTGVQLYPELSNAVQLPCHIDQFKQFNEISFEEPKYISDLQALNISFAYHLGSNNPDYMINQYILKSISAEFSLGKVTLISGLSGSGKSTLLALLAGLMSPQQGKVLLKNSEVHPGDVGYCFQNPCDQVFKPTVMEDICFGPINQGLTKPEAIQRAYVAMSIVGLDHSEFSSRDPFGLSGGELRRVAIAGILAMDSDYILFDEPTVGLDASGKANFISLIQLLIRQNKGIVIVSHDLTLFNPSVDTIYVLEAGQIIKGYARNCH